jgi:hypothetical protein
MIDLSARAIVTQATHNAFYGKPFRWGVADCLCMVQHHVRLAGHAVPDLPKYGSAKGALVAIRAQGAESLIDLVSQYLEPIIPAFAMLGDVIAVPGKVAALPALVIKTDSLFFGFADEHPQCSNVLLPPDQILNAWRIKI